MTYQGGAATSTTSWYAVWTKSRQEKTASAMLDSLGISHFLPLQSVVRQWSDRKQVVNVPLFPSYLFVQMNLLSASKLQVLKTPGVVGFVGNMTGPLPIPDAQIESVRRLVESGEEYSSHATLKKGDRVAVVQGPLRGVEGTLLQVGPRSKLVVAIELIQRSVVVTVSEDDLKRLPDAAINPN
jgi:transcription termination/antitermination protein NusG